MASENNFDYKLPLVFRNNEGERIAVYNGTDRSYARCAIRIAGAANKGKISDLRKNSYLEALERAHFKLKGIEVKPDEDEELREIRALIDRNPEGLDRLIKDLNL